MLLSPFLARTVKSLPLVRDDAVDTMATDGRTIRYHYAWCAQLTLAEVTGTRVHECGHVLLGHHVRRGARDPLRWNAAADYEINPYVIAAGYTLPSGVLLDARYAGLSAEEIYELLPASVKLPSWGRVDDASADPAELKRAHVEWRLTAQAMTWAALPGSLARALRDQLTPRPTLLPLLSGYLSRLMPADETTWTTPSRRHAGLPGRAKIASGYIVACVDTSGSIDEAQLAEALSMILALPSLGRLDVIAADAAIQGIWEEISEPIQLASRLRGGGGTDFRPGLAAAAERQPDVIVYFTDGAGSFPSRPPPCPVIFVLPDGAAAPPFGIAVFVGRRP